MWLERQSSHVGAIRNALTLFPKLVPTTQPNINELHIQLRLHTEQTLYIQVATLVFGNLKYVESVPAIESVTPPSLLILVIIRDREDSIGGCV